MTHQALRAHRERGGLPFGMIIGVAIVVALVYTGIQLIPLYWDHLNFKDDTEASVKLLFVRFQRNQEKELVKSITDGLNKIGAVYDPKKDIKVKVLEKEKFASAEVSYALPHKVPLIENPIQFHIIAESSGGM